MNRRLCPWVALVVGVMVTGGCGRGGSTPDVAAVVEGTEIQAVETEALLEASVRNELAQAGSGAGRIDGDRKQTLTHFVLLYQIKHALLRHLADGMNISVEAKGLSPEAEAGRLSEAMAQRLFPDVAGEQRLSRFLAWFDEQLRAARVRVDGRFGRWDPGRGVVR